MKINFKKLLLYVVGTIIVGSLPAMLLGSSFDSYSLLEKPPLSPSGIVFPIVWTILYILQGVSLYLASEETYDTKIYKIYITQLIVNSLWSIFFFGLNLYWFSALWILLLIILVIWMIIEFYKVNKVSAYLQIPYLLWLIFALYLNVSIAILN